jgi:nicotinamidase-related amidase
MIKSIFSAIKSLLLKKTECEQQYATLEVRKYKLNIEADSEYGSYSYTENKTIMVNKSALILVDVWADFSNKGWLRRASEFIPAIKNVLSCARDSNILVIHAPTKMKIHSEIMPLPDERILDINKPSELNCILKSYGIETLFYVGFATNICVPFKPFGMYHMKPYGYDMILIRDATTGFEYHDTLDDLTATRMAIRMIESQIGSTITSKSFIESLMKRYPVNQNKVRKSNNVA